MKKRILCFAVVSAIVSYFAMPLAAHGEETLESAQARYDAALSQYNLGSAGFFKDLANQGDTDAQQAYEIITAKNNALQNNKSVDYSVYTHLGATNDATNLENMKKAVDELNEVNRYRQNENATESTSLVDLQVTSSLMAISQYQLNYSKGEGRSHSQAFNVGENLAWGYTNPFTGWYDEEKVEYKNGNVGAAGHYLNIVNDGYRTMGYSYVSGSGVQYGSAYGQTFDFSPTRAYTGNAVSVSQYQAKFNTYYNQVKQELADASKALEAAGGIVSDQNNQVTNNPQTNNTETNNTETINTETSNAQANQAGVSSQTDQAIKNTAGPSNIVVLVTVIICGIAFVTVIGKERKA